MSFLIVCFSALFYHSETLFKIKLVDKVGPSASNEPTQSTNQYKKNLFTVGASRRVKSRLLEFIYIAAIFLGLHLKIQPEKNYHRVCLSISNNFTSDC